jgi:hypothetical protein
LNNLIAQGTAGFQQLASACSGADVQQLRDLIVIIAFYYIKIKDYAIAVGKGADELHEFGGAQAGEGIDITGLDEVDVKTDIGNPDPPFLQYLQCGVNDDASDPAFQRAFKPILAEVGKYLDEGVLEHVFRFGLVTGVSAANGHHFAGETLKEPTLAFCVSFEAVLDQLLVGHFSR